MAVSRQMIACSATFGPSQERDAATTPAEPRVVPMTRNPIRESLSAIIAAPLACEIRISLANTGARVQVARVAMPSLIKIAQSRESARGRDESDGIPLTP